MKKVKFDPISNTGEMESYHAHTQTLPGTMLKDIRQKELGFFHNISVWFIDGAEVRDNLDIDFVAGGNPGRYSYVPEKEIWLEKSEHPEDVAAVLLHEYTEMNLMEQEGETYDVAHAKASKLENTFRSDEGFKCSFGNLITKLTTWEESNESEDSE